jgi:hypothetical protein
MVDSDGTRTKKEWPDLPVGQIVDSSELLPAWPSDTSLQAWLVSRLNQAGGGKFIFDHLYNA